MAQATGTPRKFFLIATESSGDHLGAALMAELRQRFGADAQFVGIGGREMEGEGLATLFPIGDLAIVGLSAVARQLPMLLRRIREATAAVLQARPDILVIIDSPDFTHRVAKRVRKADPSIPIVDYVSPSVWAWRPGRAKAMARYVDHVLALLPFEPEEHRKLGGPACTYVGHPLIERLATLCPDAQETERRQSPPPVLVLLPGSRRGEIRNHMAVFGETLAALKERGVVVDAVLPTLPHLADMVREAAAQWPVAPRIVTGEAEKRAAFRSARAALAKSGTVTLELALAGVPMVTLYRGTAIEAWVARRVVRVPSIILANLVIGENVVPEFHQEECTAANLVPVLRDILSDTAARKRQLEAFAKLDKIMDTGACSPSEIAADVVIDVLGKRKPHR
ncbi:lipid-A-disaccharide synthase [Afipia carboxidovorans OM5]|uniref:Lipid-A-disaccharide synthase n=1 Tax=Afipia carboxidovorans (strain ATCC 49405 / DSM 1227 / KCTC 32145 / OM5) TaxID=504832 RepID=B6JH79_AFIC5|nr:lipid-A-disaccharide synthase [Afipia carboxidovorans]ACI93089.1 lipid-A-disaccharide synthase [Afipia carboxidovorans OM5]AEI03185.1 lipid-A-disaccharide synthase LpxB [Afipia carboxidovorans OM4]AEI06762.1 lipid-A-disaccharide synthase LpxB [Afipia carboxidovorans OM5]